MIEFILFYLTFSVLRSKYIIYFSFYTTYRTYLKEQSTIFGNVHILHFPLIQIIEVYFYPIH